jgi:hypothetical protein
MTQEKQLFSEVEVTISIKFKNNEKSYHGNDSVSYSRTHTSGLNITDTAGQRRHARDIMRRELQAFFDDAMTELRSDDV